MEKAAGSAADAIFLDLEDAVAEESKGLAREMAIAALNDLDWGGKQMAVRINALDTPWAHRDIIEVVSRAPRLDLLLIPKATSAHDVKFVEQLVVCLERETPRSAPLGLEVLIETAAGVANVEQIAGSSPRLEAMILGLGDYSIEMRTYDFVVGRPSVRYAVHDGATPHLNDQWHFALARIANACRAFGLRPIDGPFADFGNPSAYRAAAARAAALGFEGKWAIHPSQIEIANDVFTPGEDEVRWAREVTSALAKSTAAGTGAIAVDGVLLDLAHLKLAKTILDRADLVQAGSQRS